MSDNDKHPTRRGPADRQGASRLSYVAALLLVALVVLGLIAIL